MSSKERLYAAGFLPTDDCMMLNRNVWCEFFKSKEELPTFEQSIDQWVMEAEDEDDDDDAPVVTDLEASVVEYDSNVEIDVENNKKSGMQLQVQPFGNVRLKSTKSDKVTKTLNLIKLYYNDIVRSRKEKWVEMGIYSLHPPRANGKVNAEATDNKNDWFDNFDRIKKSFKITETRTISITAETDNDSVDTAEYIRGARGKGNKSAMGKTKNRIFKKYSYKHQIESNKTLIRSKPITKPFPLHDSLVTPPKNKFVERKCSQQYVELTSSEETSTSDYDAIKPKIGRPMDKEVRTSRKPITNRKLKKIGSSRCTLIDKNTTKNNSKLKSLHPRKRGKQSKIHASSSSSYEDNLPRHKEVNRNSRLLNQTHISSDEIGDSDPDDRVLDKVRTIYNAASMNLSKEVKSQSESSKPQPIIEFPPEPEQRLVLHEQPIYNEVIEISDLSLEDTDDILSMSNQKRSRLFGQSFDDSSCRKVAAYNPRPTIRSVFSGDSSTDDGLFKPKSYFTVQK